MDKIPTEFNIDTYIKPDFDLVIELDDEVEYLIDKVAVESIKNNESTVSLKRLIDDEMKATTIERIIKALQTNGPSDYLGIK